MKHPTYLTNLPAAVCYDYFLCTYIRICYHSIKTLYRQFFYYWICSQSSNWFCGRKKKKVWVGLYQIYRKGEAQFWLDRLRGKLLKIFLVDPLKVATPYCVKSEEGIEEIVIGIPNPSPPSYVFIDRKSPLLLINNIIDYNYRIYSDPIPISSKSIDEIKNNYQGKKYACSLDKYITTRISLPLLKSVRVLAIMLSSKTQVIMPVLTTNFFPKLPTYFTMNLSNHPAKQRSSPTAQNGQPDRLSLGCPRLVPVASLPKKPARWDFTSSFLNFCYSVNYT